MCLHCLRSPYDFFRQQTRTKPYRDLADIVQQPQGYRTIIVLSSRTPYINRTMPVRWPCGSRKESVRPLCNCRVLFCFVWFDSLRPINNLSVIKGRVFLGWTSTKLGLMFLLKDTTQWRRWGSNPRPFGLESSTLPLSHCAPSIVV